MSDPSDDWAEDAAGWDDDPAVRAYASAAYESLTRLGPPLEGATVLDFGCGTGLLTERLAPLVRRIDAVDTSAAMIEVLREKVVAHDWPNVTTHTEPDAAVGSFDLVVASSVCSFLDDYPETLRRLVGSLTPGGRFVQWDWERTSDDGHGFTRDEIDRALTAAGLVDTEVHTAFTVEFEGTTMAPLMGTGRRPVNG